LFGVSQSAAHRVIDTVGPLLALAPVRTFPAQSRHVGEEVLPGVAGDGEPMEGEVQLTGSRWRSFFVSRELVATP
jgi:hypothetical protein